MRELDGTYVWVFNGARSSFPAGVFTSVEQAETYIVRYRLSGTLTSYPLGVLVYEWARRNSLLNLKDEDSERPAEFIQRFTTASQEHHHYEEGNRET